MANRPVDLTENQVKRLGGLYRQERQGPKQPTHIPVIPATHTILEVKLLDDLDSPDEPDEPTECEANVYRGADEDWGPHTIQGQQEKVKVKNRNPDFSAAEDDFILVIRINGEWRPMSGGGGGFALAVLKAGDSISKRSGNTPGQGTVTLEKYSDGSIEELEKTVTVYNNFKSTIDTESDEDEDEEPQDIYIQMTKAFGKWWVTGVDCADDEEE